ncbi:MAG: SurA N-terminal domain-containing protein, partial [Hymenobacteraceae bacterium]|nr:SurA N-terminal domain-containing protein [Hymenobacteraceae bacterium]MDX5397258.1 SurA N-terminal domain-containing protein [Hymenobacteraceae bacterium]MDX5513336.1 SurA N-terminal domain-containing protein [Hymenobacteraceae bacterium]
MALINKIREKSGWAVGAIAVGLTVFVVGGDLLGPNSRLLGGSDNTVGEIAGEEITYQQFDQTLEELKRAYITQNNRQPTENEMGALREQAWNQLIFRVAYQDQFDELGLGVTDEELYYMVQGNNVHPAIRQAFTNPETGEFDRSMVVNYLKNLDKLPPEQREMWYSFEASLRPDRLRTKYDNLLKMSTYATTAEAKMMYHAQNDKASVKYLHVPYFSIADSTIEVSDAQLQTYLDKNKERYKLEASRGIEYAVVAVKASAEDSTYYQEELNAVVKNFATAENDSMFVRANSETPYTGRYVNTGELPEQLRSQMPLEEGRIYGPYTNNGTFTVYKVSDVKEADQAAVRASHILIKPENETPEAKAEALKKAKDILNHKKAGADYSQMAQQHGTDGTAAVGGDLGWFTEGRMVPEFEKAVFGFNGTGLLPNPVETNFGYHIIKVTEPKTKQSYQLATIERNISAGDASRDAAFRKADELAGTSSSLDEFRENVAKDNTIAKLEAKDIRNNAQNVNNLTGARELVRWAYSEKTNVGDVSPVFEVGDQFVVAVLTNKREKGYPAVADIREELTAAVRQEEKAKTIVGKLSGI